MRIITGSARGRKLYSLEGNDVRPTTDRVKESLFNILQFAVEGRAFLDLFAGSGQIGLEAISRGAESCVFVDASKKSAAVIEKNIEATGFSEKSKLINADSTVYIKHTAEKFDIAFLDPPYRMGLIAETLPFVAEAMNPGGIIICEHPTDDPVPEKAGSFVKKKDYRYGKILLTSYVREN